MSNTIQKIKELRTKIPSLPLSQAKELLNKHNDVEVCIQTFHTQNINTICRLTDCDNTRAKKYYNAYNYDVTKTVEKLYRSLKCVELCINPVNNSGIFGFVFSAENDIIEKNNIKLPIEELFIQTEDFEFIKSAFDKLFPMQLEGYIQTQIDSCDYNIFNQVQANIVLRNLSELPTQNENEELFLRRLCSWLKSQLLFADRIIVEGYQ